MLQKRFVGHGKVEVTFRMPPLDGVVELNLRGEFNHWDVKGVPLSLETDGTWSATLLLDEGRSYRFRYFDNQGSWHNDTEADRYVQNDYGTEDSVVDLTAEKASAPSEKPRAERKKVERPTRHPGRKSHAR